MATGPVGQHREEELLAEIDEMARRCAAAEQRAAAAERRAEELTAEVARLRVEADVRAEQDALPFFGDDGSPEPGDGSDARIVSVALGATAVVTGLVALLALANGTLFTTFGAAMVVLTLVLAVAAARMRVQRSEVTVVDGVVRAEHGGSSYRFDLRSDATRVEVEGAPGDSYWQVRFLRRHLDPLVVDTDMVDPAAFMAELRRYRPDL